MVNGRKKNKQNDGWEIVRRFVRWHRKKTSLEMNGRTTKIRQGEIYWAAVGQNIGTEIYGKGENFSRPILIYKKLNDANFLAIPLTSKHREGSWYVPFLHRGILETAMLNQIKIMHVKRLYGKMGEIDEDDFDRVREGFRKLYC